MIGMYNQLEFQVLDTGKIIQYEFPAKLLYYGVQEEN